jgi:hypothetical protein
MIVIQSYHFEHNKELPALRQTYRLQISFIDSKGLLHVGSFPMATLIRVFLGAKFHQLAMFWPFFDKFFFASLVKNFLIFS